MASMSGSYGGSHQCTALAKGGASAGTFFIFNTSARSYLRDLRTTIYGKDGGLIICNGAGGFPHLGL